MATIEAVLRNVRTFFAWPTHVCLCRSCVVRGLFVFCFSHVLDVGVTWNRGDGVVFAFTRTRCRGSVEQKGESSIVVPGL